MSTLLCLFTIALWLAAENATVFSIFRASHGRLVCVDIFQPDNQSSGPAVLLTSYDGWPSVERLQLHIGTLDEYPEIPDTTKYSWLKERDIFRIPLIAIAGIAAVPMVVVGARAVRRRRISTLREADKLCVLCGYDLRATPDRCPECGTATTTSK
jgi:hypothetical protein